MPPAALTITIVFVILVLNLPQPAFLTSIWLKVSSPFKNFLTLEETEAFNKNEKGDAKVLNEVEEEAHPRAIWHATAIASVALFESGIWFALGSARIVNSPTSWFAWSCIISAVPWIYATIRPFAKPMATPPYDLFWTFVMKLFACILYLGGLVYDAYVFDIPAPPGLQLAALILDAVAIITVIVVIVSLPMNFPRSSVDKEKIVRSCVTPTMSLTNLL